MSRRSLGRYLHTIRLNQIFNHKLILVLCLKVCDKDLIWCEVLGKLHLIGKDIRFMLVTEIIIDHAPHGGLS